MENKQLQAIATEIMATYSNIDHKAIPSLRDAARTVSFSTRGYANANAELFRLLYVSLYHC
ncbi:MAG: hypothetical protein ACYTX0_42015 [Nostoc sp.]